MIDLLQAHTVDIYSLKDKEFKLGRVLARKLITFDRFDLFAKIAYIKYRRTNPEYAIRIYSNHIKAFNPDLKEPGRKDKNGIEDFIVAFDKLIDHFKEFEFDKNISLIPVSESGEILDGSHRVAALAYFNKKVDIIKFKGVQPVATFNYVYFIKKGLPINIADLITYEGIHFSNDTYVACLWPKLGSKKNRFFALNYFNEHFQILYIKNAKMSLKNLGVFMYEIYKHQEWVGTNKDGFAGSRDKALKCFGGNKLTQFIIFKSSSLEKVLKAKETIRSHYNLEKHALHITDNDEETKEIAELIFIDKKYTLPSGINRFFERVNEFISVFKNVYMINLKVGVAKFLKRIKLYK